MKSLAPHSGLRKPGRTLSKLLARLIYSRASVHASRSIETMSGCASLVSAGGSGPRQFSAIRLLLFRPNERKNFTQCGLRLTDFVEDHQTNDPD